MAKFSNDNNADVLLNRIKNNSKWLTINSSQPGTWTQAYSTTAANLGRTAITSADFTGPADSTLGRKVTKDQETGISITISATANHVALISSSTGSSEILVVTTISNSQAVTTGNTATVNSFIYHVVDVT